jgi:hypothetical protein
MSKAKDPDIMVPLWLDKNVPCGIDQEIVPRGIFPVMESTGVAPEAFRDASLFQAAGGEDFGNYQSVNVNDTAATVELTRERDAGYLEWFRTRRQMERRLGKCWPSKVAVLVKYADDGSILKVRLIHDLRRSGVNAKVRVKERLVLPRVGDALNDILELLEAFPGMEIEMEAADFKDAFKQMRAGEPERKYLCGKALGGWFSYKTVLFGLERGRSSGAESLQL